MSLEIVSHGDTRDLDDRLAGAPPWAIALYEQNAEILETHVKILAVVEEIKPEVMTVVNSLQKNPMFKMFLGGK